MAAAAAVGFGGAAVVDTAFAAPAIEVADGSFGPGDGLTRLVVTVPDGDATAHVSALEAVDGVAHAQPLFDGSVLVAGDGITPAAVRDALPGAEVSVSEPGQVFAAPVSDPFWSSYGWNLANTGTNSYNQTGVAGADVAAPAGWRAGTGAGTVVAVIDTGQITSHPDLQGALWTNPAEACGGGDTDGDGYAGDCHGWNFYKNNADITNAGEDNGHGTGVAGILGARAGNGQGSAGVAPGVTIMPLVIGGGRSVDLALGAQAIRYAADHGADVVNASWGGTGASTILKAAIDYANSKGTVVVAAAGNDAGNRDTTLYYPASLDAPNLLTVGNSTAADGVSSSSAYGATTVDLFAPGHLVLAPKNDGGYWLMSGTSMAAPHVAGAAALHAAHDPTASAAEITAAIMADVVPVPAFAGKSVSGGRLSLAALGGAAADVAYTFTGMVQQPGSVAPTVVVSGAGDAGTYSVQLGLGMEHEGQVHALTRHAVSLGGITAPTDDEGVATYSLGSRPGLGTVTLDPTTTLAVGRYVLTAQLYLDGAALGPAHAAPLIVSEDVPTTPGSPTPSNPSTRGTSTPGTSTPGTPTPGTYAPGTSSPGTSTPSTPGTSAPGTSAPGTSAPGTSTPPTPSTSTPGTSTPGSSSPGTSTPTTSAPANPGSSPPGSSTPSTPTPSNPSSGGSNPGGSAPDLGGSRTYPAEGAFRLTSISPARVSAAGGSTVTITGEAIPAGARVRIGSSAAATVTSSSTTRLTFTAPARVAGGYDVFVFSADGTASSVLTAGLTYVDAATGGASNPGTSTPGASTPSNPATSTPSDPGSATPGTATPTPAGGGRATVPGPNGERLMTSARFAALGSSIWRLDCSSSCRGMVV
ncbi:S8 family serine peptidase [Geodermatophilus sp. SYSU D00815]